MYEAEDVTSGMGALNMRFVSVVSLNSLKSRAEGGRTGIRYEHGRGLGRQFIVASDGIARLANKRELEMAHSSDVFQRQQPSTIDPLREWSGVVLAGARKGLDWRYVTNGNCKAIVHKVIVINTVVIPVMGRTIISIDTGNQFVTFLFVSRVVIFSLCAVPSSNTAFGLAFQGIIIIIY